MAARLRRDQVDEVVAHVRSALRDGYVLGKYPGRNAVAEGHRRMVASGKAIQENTFRSRYRLGVKTFKIKVEEDAVESPAVQGTPLHAKIVGLQDQVTRLTKELKQAHRENNVAEMIHQAIGFVASADRQPPPWLMNPEKRPRGKPDPEVPMTCWADWHLGEVVEEKEVHGYNKYNVAIAEARCQRLFESTVHLARNHHTGNYPGIIVNCVGDMVSGGIHPELMKTDEIDSIPAALKAIDLIVTGLTMMKASFKNVYVPTVCGNHGRTTAKPEFKRYYQKNFDYLIACVVARHFADDDQVTIDIRPSNDVHYRVYGLRFMLNHGDMLGVRGGDGIIGAIGPIMRGEIKKSGQSSALGIEYDINIMGHWHQELLLPRAIVSNTLKGFDEYARLQLGAKPTRPSQPLWFVHPGYGITDRKPIYVDDKPATVPDQAWVSVFER